ncbi:MAG: SGNH/GDSL hydrolase family protein [Actinobacteria bacterium]|nr:SGNH/GDSL hydrolase family protein [Actinomycetota bacterium]
MHLGPVRPAAWAELAGGAMVTGYALLCAEGAWASWRIHGGRLGAPAADGVYGGGRGEPLTLIVMGDSLAAGLGADQPGQTPGALLAAGVARAAGRPVRLRTVARSGARTRDLPAQLELAREARPAAAVIVVGGNDITHMLVPGTPALINPLRRVVAELVSTGAAVLVATCPDVGSIPPIPQPLRALARRASRAVARAQAVAALAEGARTVSLGYLLGPVMRERQAQLFAADHFHPSAAAYAIAAQVMLPPLLAALHVRPGQPGCIRRAGSSPSTWYRAGSSSQCREAGGRFGSRAEAAGSWPGPAWAPPAGSVSVCAGPAPRECSRQGSAPEP